MITNGQDKLTKQQILMKQKIKEEIQRWAMEVGLDKGVPSDI